MTTSCLQSSVLIVNNWIIHLSSYFSDVLFCQACEDYFLFATVHTATIAFCATVTHIKTKLSTCHRTDKMAWAGLELENIVEKCSPRTRLANVLTRATMGGEKEGGETAPHLHVSSHY